MKSILVAFILLLLVGLGHATYLRNFAWKSEQTLWADASMKAPDQFRAHHNLGLYYQQQGRLQEAIAEFEKALTSKGVNRKTEKIVTYYQLGRVYYQLGDFQKSKGFYEKALQMDADLPQALADLAVLYASEGDSRIASVYLERAFTVDPGNPYVNFNMGLHRMRQGEMDRAEHHFVKASEAETLGGSAHLYLGVIYKQKKQLDRGSAGRRNCWRNSCRSNRSCRLKMDRWSRSNSRGRRGARWRASRRWWKRNAKAGRMPICL